MRLTITYNDRRTETVIISTNCSTEELIAKIEHYEYQENVSSVKVVEVETPEGFVDMFDDEF